MVDVLEAIDDAYERYKDRWMSVISAFVVIFLIGVIFGAANLVLRIFESVCQGVSEKSILVLLCLSPTIFSMMLGVINGLINIAITMAVIKPLDEMGAGKSISSWFNYFLPQLLNGIIIMVLRAVLMIVCLVPAVVILFSNVALLSALRNNSNSTTALLSIGGIFTFFIALAVGIIVMVVINFLLMFLEVEVVLGGRGIINASISSANMVKNNLLDTFLYSILWWLIGTAVGVVTLLLVCTICLMPLAFLISPFIVEPISLLSKILLWRRLGGVSPKGSAG